MNDEVTDTDTLDQAMCAAFFELGQVIGAKGDEHTPDLFEATIDRAKIPEAAWRCAEQAMVFLTVGIGLLQPPEPGEPPLMTMEEGLAALTRNKADV